MFLMKAVLIKDESTKLLFKEARAKVTIDRATENVRVTDELVIKEALRYFLGKKGEVNHLDIGL